MHRKPVSHPVVLASFAAVVCICRVLAAAADPEWAEVVLSQDYRLTELRQMPRVEPEYGRTEPRRYTCWNAVEWQLRLQAPTRGEMPLFEELKSADFVVQFPLDSPVILHSSQGSHDEPSDFQPRNVNLEDGRVVTFESFGGRSSDGVMPYFNLAASSGGLVVAVGWTGDWRASFERLGQGRGARDSWLAAVTLQAAIRRAGAAALDPRDGLSRRLAGWSEPVPAADAA